MNTRAATHERQFAVWERWWASVGGTPGEIVWDADRADLEGDIDAFADAFGHALPVIDLGCGDGRQTRFLARHFRTVVGVDFSPAAVRRARGGGNPPNIRYRVLDARSPELAAELHAELGDANVYVRGVLQALPAVDRPVAVGSIGLLLGQTGTLFAKELPPQAGAYFAEMIARHGMWPELERLMRRIPPGQITEAELVHMLSADRFDVLASGTSRIETVNVLPDGERIRVPAIYVLARARRSTSRPGTRPAPLS